MVVITIVVVRLDPVCDSQYVVVVRMSRFGINISNAGRKCGQQATIIPELIWAMAHNKLVPSPYVTSPS